MDGYAPLISPSAGPRNESSPGGVPGSVTSPHRCGEAGLGDVRRAVAQAMRYAGCLNRRSLGVSDVFPELCAAAERTMYSGRKELLLVFKNTSRCWSLMARLLVVYVKSCLYFLHTCSLSLQSTNGQHMIMTNGIGEWPIGSIVSSSSHVLPPPMRRSLCAAISEPI